MERIREGIEAMDFEGIGTGLSQLFERIHQACPRQVGKYVISRSLATLIEEHCGKGVTAQYAIYDEVWPETQVPPGFKKLPNGRLMPIVTKGSGPKFDPVHQRGRRHV